MILVLASKSPRRTELLTLGGWEFRTHATEVDETPLPDEDPQSYVLRMAEKKARASSKHAVLEFGPNCLIIGADTTVVDAGEDKPGAILGKPADNLEAERMLRRLRDRQHFVYTAVAVYRPSDDSFQADLCSTVVEMRNYTDEEMSVYIASGDPLDKAGAYAIQHPVFNPVRSIRGCFANVVGMPLCLLSRLLGKMGVSSPYVFPECNFENCPVCHGMFSTKIIG
jgi:septum formation protein